jgi:RNA polymerase sigma factor (sigma-70 family)
LESISDNALMLKVKDGDIDKLGLLYERHKGAIFGYLYGMNHDSMLAEDLLQMVFIRVLKYKSGFRGDGKFTTWLFHITRNVNADYHRKRKRDPNALGEDLFELEYQLAEEPTEDKEASLQLLDKALQLLGAEQKEVLVLTKLKHMKYRDVADIYGITEGAIKAKVFRAMQSLKVKYAQLETMVS